MSSKNIHSKNEENGRITLPVLPADILIPGKDIDRGRFAVVACDQFTQDKAYWDRVYKLADGVPSAAHIMLPEAFLDEGQKEIDRRIAGINETMADYLESGVFDEYKESMILTLRTFKTGKKRAGLVAAIDLEQYDYKKGSVSPVRATEATVLERIPPRVAIRRGARLEMPHIMILIDDPGMTVIEPLEKAAEAGAKTPAYDFELMEGGGNVKGWVLHRSEYENALNALKKLSEPEAFRKKYALPDDVPVMLLAIGDGNHSLASAKALYEETHAPEMRYALAEIVNIHSPGIEFEPIHRVMMNIDPAEVEAEARSYFGDDLIIGKGCAKARGLSASGIKHAAEDHFRIEFVSKNIDAVWYVSRARHLLSAGAIQEFLDSFISRHPEAKIDYIHGDSECKAIGRAENSCGFILDAMPKSDLFPTVIKNGALPRKTFSMGNAEEKRYYFECRRIG